MTQVAEVRLWGTRIGAVSLTDGERTAAFQYEPAFADHGIELCPPVLPLSRRIYSFPALNPESFHGLPGMLADSLPDRFGRAIINAWLATQGRTPESFSVIEQLCYIGARGMGALEYLPATAGPDSRTATPLDVTRLVELASEVLTARGALQASFATDERRAALAQILQVGTSAGGARAKAVIAWNPATNEVRSGQVAAPAGFDHWLLKFDGVSGNRDKEDEDPKGYTVVEYAYSLMARAAGIQMSECRLFEDGRRRHFMTRRFDRPAAGGKLHMQSLAALAHLDFNRPEGNTYEQAFDVIHQLQLQHTDAAEQLYRRMLFNVMARNQDDHVKNIAFLMDKSGSWRLGPAFDVTFSYNPQGVWTARHQMSINGRREDFTREDFRHCAQRARIARGAATSSFDAAHAAVSRWPEFAAAAGVADAQIKAIAAAHRLDFPQ
jgi:serine/threonine-protein kinase HipA